MTRPYTFSAEGRKKRGRESEYPDSRPLFVFSTPEKTPKKPSDPHFGVFLQKNAADPNPHPHFWPKRPEAAGCLTPLRGALFGVFWSARVFGLWGAEHPEPDRGFWLRTAFA